MPGHEWAWSSIWGSKAQSFPCSLRAHHKARPTTPHSGGPWDFLEPLCHGKHRPKEESERKAVGSFSPLGGSRRPESESRTSKMDNVNKELSKCMDWGQVCDSWTSWKSQTASWRRWVFFLGYKILSREYCLPGSTSGKEPPANRWEMWVRFLGQEDLLEEEMATHSSILAWRISWIEEHCGLQSVVSQRVRHDLALALPDGPLAKTLSSQCRGPGLDPWSGN